MIDDNAPDHLNTFTVSVIIGGILLAVLLSLGACKVPPVATAYRSYGLFINARDAGGGVLAKIQRAKMIKCEADHTPLTPAGKAALLACYKAAREPVKVWVKYVKPSIASIAAAMWLAAEAVYAVGRKDLDKIAKATLLACSTLTAGEVVALKYGDKLGSLKGLILGIIAGGKILVCK